MKMLLLCLLALPLAPQQPTREELQARVKAHRGDFDYLLGDWEFNGESAQRGKYHGYWSAMRMDTGDILDEYRIVNDTGQTEYVTSTIRAYNASLDRWELVGLGGGNGLQDFGTGHRDGDEVHIEQKYGASTMRIRYHHIQADHFSWVADRSGDGGKTWVKDAQKLEAHRIGASRTLGRLTPSPTK